MPGTLVISDLSDGTNSTSATNCIQGSAKAWVNFNGTGTPAIRASYNVSSITDNGTGNYFINFTNALPDANYAASFLGSDANWGSVAYIASYTTTSLNIVTLANAGTNTADLQTVGVAIFR